MAASACVLEEPSKPVKKSRSCEELKEAVELSYVRTRVTAGRTAACRRAGIHGNPSRPHPRCSNLLANHFLSPIILACDKLRPSMGTEILKGAKAHPSYFTAARENTRKIDTTFATKNF